MRTTRHSLMAKGILVLLSLMILIFTFSYSWFIPPNMPVDATGIEISTRTAADFDIAIGYTSPSTGDYVISDWITGSSAGEVKFYELPKIGSSTEKLNMLRDFKPVDITSDGRTFIRPDMKAKNAGINLNKDTYEYAIPNQQYISFDLIIRSRSGGASIKLGEDSVVLGVNENGTKNASSLVGSGFGVKQSSYGDFSEDSVIGAVRVSFVGYTNTLTYNNIFDLENTVDRGTLNNAASLLWIPRPDMFLKAVDNAITGWTLVTGSSLASTTAKSPDNVHLPSDTDTYTCEELASTHYYYAIFDNTVNRGEGGIENYRIIDSVDDGGIAVTDLADASSIPIVTTSVSHGSDQYHYGKCQVNVWVDGCDAEARRAVDGGQFTISFDLAAI